MKTILGLVAVVVLASTVACGSNDANPASPGGSAGGSAGAEPVSTGSLRGVAQVSAFGGSGVSGSIEFDTFEDSLSVATNLDTCTDGVEYAVDVQAGTSCANLATIGDEFNGGAYMSVTCDATNGTFDSSLHAAKLSKVSIGGDARTDIVGHVAIVRPDSYPEKGPIVACGVITKQ